MTLVLSKKHRVSLIILSGVVSVLCMLLLTPKASAATLNVVAGNDAIAENNQCQLSEAITNINDQAQTHDDCLAGNGNNDTMNLPTGTITLTADLPEINKIVNINGQGMDVSIINGNSQFVAMKYNITSLGTVDLNNFTVVAQKGSGIEIGATVAGTTSNIYNIEVDGTNSIKGAGGGIGGLVFYTAVAVNVNKVYVHDLLANSASGVFGISLQTGGNISIKNSVLENIKSDDSPVNGVSYFAGIPVSITINIDLENTSITDVSSGSSIATGVGVGLGAQNSVVNMILGLQNNTITKISSSNTYSGNIALGGLAVGASDVSNITVNATNNLIAGSSVGCKLSGDYAALFGQPPSAGTINQTLTSNGGNITDDASCNNYFNQPTDKNEVPNLSSFFNNLTNNGGTIPTIKPLPGNIAIDGGICTDQTPNTDARGITRPQGQTCDSGAYEVEQASHNTNQSTSPKQTKLITPAGVINKSFTTVSTDGLPKDNADVNYQYPLGLSTFTLEVPSGSTQAVSLFYETSLKAKQLVPRKYKTTNKIFSNIPNAQLSDVVIDGKTGVQLTYNITDGGELDQDGQVNGIIIDPVGLAQEDPSLLTNTGDFILVAIPIGTALIIATVIVTYVDYRKHKKPLLDINRDLAKSYTYWHHLKTVTIPLFSYRLSFAFEKKSNHLNISRF